MRERERKGGGPVALVLSSHVPPRTACNVHSIISAGINYKLNIAEPISLMRTFVIWAQMRGTKRRFHLIKMRSHSKQNMK